MEFRPRVGEIAPRGEGWVITRVAISRQQRPKRPEVKTHKSEKGKFLK